MKSPNKIKKALGRCSAIADCAKCPYRGEKCIERMCADAIKYIERLESELKTTKEEFDEYARQY